MSFRSERSTDWNLNNERSRNNTTTPGLARKELQSHEIISENIQKFFKYNAQNLVRPAVAVDDLEQKKARTWVFFLILVQIIVCIGYGFFLVRLPRSFIYQVLAILLLAYYGIKVILILIFNFKRLFTCQFKTSDYDPESNNYEEVFICVPVYNESKSVLEQTVAAITNANYTKHKLYVVFIVDGNKGGTFQSLMECLESTKYEERVPPSTRIIKHGICNGVNYSVFLKDQNRGKRDSQWLFIEIVRNIFPEHKPPYIVFLDSDTTFESDALRYMVDVLKSDSQVAGVCGQVRIANFKVGDDERLFSFGNIVFRLSTFVILGMTYFEYTWNTFFYKHAEGATSAVTQLYPHCSMYRTDIIVNIDTTVDIGTTVNNQTHQSLASNHFSNPDKRSNMSFYYVSTVQQNKALITQDFFSKPTTGLIDRNLYDLGSERILSSKCLQLGYKCIYDPRIICYTLVPDSIAQLLHQRRRWNNTAFIAQVVNLAQFSLWINPRTILSQLLTMFDLLGAYLLPTHAILIIHAIVAPFITEVSSISPELIIFIWVLVQVIVVSSTKLDTSDMFYVLNTFATGIIMGVSIYFFGNTYFVSIFDNVAQAASGNWPVAVVFFIFPVLFIVTSIFSPLSFIAVIGSYLMFPTMAFTAPLYSFFRLDDFSWSSR